MLDLSYSLLKSYWKSLGSDCFQVVVDNGKSDRITVVENAQNMSSQYAETKYRVIEASPHG